MRQAAWPKSAGGTTTSTITPAVMGPRRVCSVCCRAVAGYTCPRCHKAYCSSACYKQHSHQCTESFYREQATSQMKATKADAGQNEQMMRILQRLHDQDNEQHTDEGSSSHGGGSDDEEMDTTAAMAGFDALLAQSAEFQRLVERAAAEGDTFDVHPSDLSPDLAAKLQALCMSGRLSHLVPQWQPWWLSEAAANFTLGATGQRVVAELGVPSAAAAEGTEAAAAAVAAAVADSGSLGGVAALPAPPDDPLPSLAVLAGPGFQASPLLPWQLLQLLVAYCAVMRRWNGEPDCRASTGPGWEAAQQLLLAPPLGQLLSTSSSTSSKSAQNAAAKAQPEDTRLRQRQDTTQHEVADLACVPADSARCALMQLAAAAAELAPNQGCSNADPVEGDADPGLASSAAELRSLLEMANSDALALLQLGRSAVLLALTDSCRLIEQSRQHLKQQWRHKQSKGKQGLQQQAAASTIGAAKQGRKGAGCSSGNSSRAAEDQLLQHLKLAARKLHFFTAWSNEQPPDMFEHLALQLAVELQEQEAMSKPQQGTVSLAVQEAQPLAGPSTTAVFPQMQPRLRAAAAGVALQQVQRQPEQQQRPQGTQQENEAQQLHVEGEQGQHGRKTATPAASLQGQPQQQEQLECWAGQLLQTEACNVSRAHQDGSRMQASSAGPALSVGGGPELSSRQVAEMTGLYELD